MAAGPADESERVLSRVCNPKLSRKLREAALDELLDRRRGFWGDVPLLDWLYGVAKGEAQSIMGRQHLSADEIDWEGAAHEALIALVSSQKPVTFPKAWLRETIRRRIQDQKRSWWSELIARDLTDARDIRVADDDVAGPDESRRLKYYDLVLTKIAELPASLRVVAQMLLVERYSVEEIRELLALSNAAMRQRMFRLKGMLRKILDVDD